MEEGLGRFIEGKNQTLELKGLTLHPLMTAQTHHQFVDDTLLMCCSLVHEAKDLKNSL